MTTAGREARFWKPSVQSERRADGSILIWQSEPLGPYPLRTTELLMHWAGATPSAVWLAERSGDGWRRITYAEAAEAIPAIGAALLDRGLSAERPLVILSGNSIAHALMALGAQHVGIPSAALAPAYSLSGGDFRKLREVERQMTAGMVFAGDAARFAPAIGAVFGRDIPVVACEGTVPGRECLAFDDLVATQAGAGVARAHLGIGAGTIAKFLFTSGTTGSPKAVIQTHGMLMSNQQSVLQCFAFLAGTPPVVVDWAPWNHTASGNKVFNMVHYNGGTYHIDDGRPTAGEFGRSIRNLREISPTWYFNVPLGYQMLADAMEGDRALGANFFRRLQMMMYAGAGMSQPVWDRVTRLAEASVPGGVLLTTGFGATETGPFALMCTERQDRAGNLGIPAHGVTLKLVPGDGRLEARVRGPSVTTGYWRDPEQTRAAFDDEGFYRFGDAMRFVDPGNPAAGLRFDGRLAENFKLASGTWVAVGSLRAALVNDLGGLASDVVIAGEGRDALGALVLPDRAALGAIAGDPAADIATLCADPDVRAAFRRRLAAHAARASGSASRVTRLVLLAEPLDFDQGEVTDKGSVNQRAVLRHRAGLVERLWAEDPLVIRPAPESGV